MIAVLRQAPPVARSFWATFREADLTGRVVFTLFGTVFATVAGYALSAIVPFAGLGTEVFIGERGQFSGAGITTVWPNR